MPLISNIRCQLQIVILELVTETRAIDSRLMQLLKKVSEIVCVYIYIYIYIYINDIII